MCDTSLSADIRSMSAIQVSQAIGDARHLPILLKQDLTHRLLQTINTPETDFDVINEAVGVLANLVSVADDCVLLELQNIGAVECVDSASEKAFQLIEKLSGQVENIPNTQPHQPLEQQEPSSAIRRLCMAYHLVGQMCFICTSLINDFADCKSKRFLQPKKLLHLTSCCLVSLKQLISVEYLCNGLYEPLCCWLELMTACATEEPLVDFIASGDFLRFIVDEERNWLPQDETVEGTTASSLRKDYLRLLAVQYLVVARKCFDSFCSQIVEEYLSRPAVHPDCFQLCLDILHDLAADEGVAIMADDDEEMGDESEWLDSREIDNEDDYDEYTAAVAKTNEEEDDNSNDDEEQVCVDMEGLATAAAAAVPAASDTLPGKANVNQRILFVKLLWRFCCGEITLADTQLIDHDRRRMELVISSIFTVDGLLLSFHSSNGSCAAEWLTTVEQLFFSAIKECRNVFDVSSDVIDDKQRSLLTVSALLTVAWSCGRLLEEYKQSAESGRKKQQTANTFISCCTDSLLTASIQYLIEIYQQLKPFPPKSPSVITYHLSVQDMVRLKAIGTLSTLTSVYHALIADETASKTALITFQSLFPVTSSNDSASAIGEQHPVVYGELVNLLLDLFGPDRFNEMFTVGRYLEWTQLVLMQLKNCRKSIQLSRRWTVDKELEGMPILLITGQTVRERLDEMNANLYRFIQYKQKQ